MFIGLTWFAKLFVIIRGYIYDREKMIVDILILYLELDLRLILPIFIFIY